MWWTHSETPMHWGEDFLVTASIQVAHWSFEATPMHLRLFSDSFSSVVCNEYLNFEDNLTSQSPTKIWTLVLTRRVFFYFITVRGPSINVRRVYVWMWTSPGCTSNPHQNYLYEDNKVFRYESVLVSTSCMFWFFLYGYENGLASIRMYYAFSILVASMINSRTR